MEYRNPFDVTIPFYGVFAAVRFLEGLGFRVLPPKPSRTRRKRFPKLRSFKASEMKAALLIAVLLEREKIERKVTTRRIPDTELLARLKKRGAFDEWAVKPLAVELSRARGWAKSEDGQRWIEQEAEWADQYLQQQTIHDERRLAGAVPPADSEAPLTASF
jgi:hypothetical protein